MVVMTGRSLGARILCLSCTLPGCGCHTDATLAREVILLEAEAMEKQSLEKGDELKCGKRTPSSFYTLYSMVPRGSLVQKMQTFCLHQI